ncbi:Clp protease-domain-containing protein [Lineolata rhizophorae]|uniref:ATP-dependent Clp protease proteolytic subunit n=1 Tax=Lineolata rhizophorae TaxID=578093 RepID=A0A6A6NYX9_9PEZI|nr:Clp protease-domain-containing protein [Lineolata rhizophorae]
MASRRAIGLLAPSAKPQGLARAAASSRWFCSGHPPLRGSASPRSSPPRAWVPTPFVTESVGSGWHTYDIFSRLLKERIVCLNGHVDDTVSASIVAQMLFLEAENPDKPINLYINSPGGSVTAGLAIYDTMTYIRSPITTICVGQAASMGSLLLCGGAPGSRLALPHASIMVHQPSGGYFGQASDIAIHAKEILRVRGQLNRIYQRHMKKGKGKDGEEGRYEVEEIEKLMERDYFMGAEEAVQLGIVDRVLERRDAPQ